MMFRISIFILNFLHLQHIQKTNIFWIYAFPISLTGIIVKFLSPYPSTE